MGKQEERYDEWVFTVTANRNSHATVFLNCRLFPFVASAPVGSWGEPRLIGLSDAPKLWDRHRFRLHFYFVSGVRVAGVFWWNSSRCAPTGYNLLLVIQSRHLKSVQNHRQAQVWACCYDFAICLMIQSFHVKGIETRHDGDRSEIINEPSVTSIRSLFFQKAL